MWCVHVNYYFHDDQINDDYNEIDYYNEIDNDNEINDNGIAQKVKEPSAFRQYLEIIFYYLHNIEIVFIIEIFWI